MHYHWATDSLVSKAQYEAHVSRVLDTARSIECDKTENIFLQMKRATND